MCLPYKELLEGFVFKDCKIFYEIKAKPDIGLMEATTKSQWQL